SSKRGRNRTPSPWLARRNSMMAFDGRRRPLSGARRGAQGGPMAADPGDRPLWPYLLLIIPFVALLWVPFYNSIEPSLWGIPFFYWYQFLWVPLTTLLIVWVHWQTADHHDNNAEEEGAEGGRL